MDTPLTNLLREMTPRQIRNSLKRAYRAEAKKVKKIAERKLDSSGLHVMGSKSDLHKGIRTRIYSRGGGFMLTVKPGKGNVKSMHKNRRGFLKPVLLWAEEGTVGRFTRNGMRRGHITGSMPSYGFMAAAEDEMLQTAENDLLSEVEVAVEKVARKAGMV